MSYRWPWVSRSLLNRAERDVEYRQAVIERLQRERDAAVEEAARARDELIMYLGARPITAPVRTDLRKHQADVEAEARAVAELFADVDSEVRLIEEGLSESAPS